METRRDIVIAGGGMVGVSLALQLAASLPESLHITLVEGIPFPAPRPGHRPDYHPAFDARSTALSYSSRLIYEAIGLWPALEQWLCPIDSIHVSSRGRFGSTLLRAGDHQWPALGYVVENAWLGNVLVQQLHRQGRVEVISPARVTGASLGENGARLSLEGEGPAALEARLLVVADGAGSGLREQLGVATSEKPYHQHAVIANIATGSPHDGCAFERFTGDGPIAMLPLPGVADAPHRSALVWTLAPGEADAMVQCDEPAFLERLQHCFGYRLGRLRRAGQRHSYPLALVQATEQVRRGLVVMGNAAHALHPVAGQGFNLALRDVACLSNVLADALAQGLDPGSLPVLERYRRSQQADQRRTITASDQLPALFMQRDPLLGLARDLALSGLDLLPALKQGFVRHAAGVAALGDSR